MHALRPQLRDEVRVLPVPGLPSQATVFKMTLNMYSNVSQMHKSNIFLKSQSELITPVSPQAAHLGIFLKVNFSHHFIEMHLLLRDLIKDTQ